MLSYKYYQDPKNKGINIPPQILRVNRIFKDEFKKDWSKTFDDLTHPLNIYENKYTIWDILTENATEILNNTLMSQYDKLYLAKLLCVFRDRTISVAPGIEYYCLREIIRLAPFSYKNNIKWIAKIMANRIRELSRQPKTKKQLIIFTRNYRKMEILKRIYKTPVISRTHWKLVYDCLTIKEGVCQELLNKTEILKYLNICQNNTNDNIDIIPDKKDIVELEQIDDVLDDEILIDNQHLDLVGLCDTEPDLLIISGHQISEDTSNQYDQLDYQPENISQIDNITEPLSGSDMEENIKDDTDDLAVEPDEW
jgi:hypothetical protein